MQIGIALSLFILLKFCDALFYRICLFLYRVCWPWWFLWLLDRPTGLETTRRIAGKAQTFLRRYQPALQLATVEFHKAQCFFMLAIGIASQIVLRQHSLEDASLQSLVNYTLVGIISMNGILPIVGTLLCLHTVHMLSLYLLILSACTTVLSTVTFFKSRKFVPSVQDSRSLQTATNVSYTSCNSKDPSTFCLDDSYSLNRSDSSLISGVGPVIFSLVILGLLILEYGRLQELISIQRIFKHFFDIMAKWSPRTIIERLGKQRERRKLTAQQCAYGMSNFVYVFIWAWYLLNLMSFCNDLSSFSPVDGWSFGQIVAIIVWAAPIVEFAKLSVRKLALPRNFQATDTDIYL